MSDEFLHSDHDSEAEPEASGGAAEPGSGSIGSGIDEDARQTVISKRDSRSTARPQSAPFRPSDVGAALEGVQLEHFRLEKFVGGGGMGAVFRAMDTTLGRVVAVKVVSSNSTDDDTLRRFRNEAQSAARLDHPNIARVYYVGEDKGWNFIVFEFIEGINVRDLVEQRGPLSIAESVSYTLQVADALAHASDRDVVHRDIKPSNILVMPSGHAKLVDMGLARLHQVDAPANDLTASGVTLGTFDYISPEQARDPRTADVRSDLYSLGCTLYYMLTGTPPFPDGTVLQKLLSHSSDSPPDPRELRPGVGDEIAAVAFKLMAKQPGQRYGTPHELIGDLVMIADLLGLEGISRSRHASMPAGTSSPNRLAWHLPWLVSLGLLLLAAVVMQSIWQPSASVSQDIPTALRLESPIAASTRPVEEDLTTESPASTRRESGSSPTTETSDPGSPSGGIAEPVSATDENGGLTGQSDSEVSRPVAEADPTIASPVPPIGGETTRPGAASPVPGSVQAAAPGADTAPAAATTVVVGSFVEATPGELIVPSLEAAFELANVTPEIDTIELRFHQREELPLTVDLRRSLIVRAGEGFAPLVLFRPKGRAMVPEWRMLKLFGDHRIEFAGIHFRVELPYEITPPCSLFDLNQINQISLKDCTLTIRNTFGVPAAFFAVRAPRVSATISDQSEVKSPSIELNRTIAHGEATLVQATKGLPFWLTWEQGLFTTTERMIETGGLPERPRLDVVRVDLTNVTASMDLGLCRVRIDDNGPYLPAIDILLRNCVLTHDAEWPLVEHLGVASLADAEEKFGFAGENNYYEFTEIRWRVQTAEPRLHEFSWTDRDGLWYDWYDEHFAEPVVRWEDEYRVKPSAFEQTADDFRLDASRRRIAGFDEQLLPTPPSGQAGSVEPSAEATPESPTASEL